MREPRGGFSVSASCVGLSFHPGRFIGIGVLSPVLPCALIEKRLAIQEVEMSEYDAWVKLCVDVGSELWCLERSESPNAGLYKTQKKFMYENREYGTDPIFHVWYQGKHMYCGSMYHDAYALYKNLIKGGL